MYFARQEEAIVQTAHKYGKLIRTIAYNLLGNQADCEECENDTYRVAWNKIPPARPVYLSVYLGRIARNLAFDQYAYNTAAKRNSELEVALSELEKDLAGISSVEDEYEQKRIANLISDFLGQTSRSKRLIFVRHYWYADSLAEIARRYGFSLSKVKSSLMRTRKELKKYLESHGVEL